MYCRTTLPTACILCSSSVVYCMPSFSDMQNRHHLLSNNAEQCIFWQNCLIDVNRWFLALVLAQWARYHPFLVCGSWGNAHLFLASRNIFSQIWKKGLPLHSFIVSQWIMEAQLSLFRKRKWWRGWNVPINLLDKMHSAGSSIGTPSILQWYPYSSFMRILPAWQS